MGWIMIMSQKKLAYQSRTNCDHMYHPLHLAFPASPLPSSRLCGTNQPSYTRSSVVGTTSSAVGPFTPALLPLQFLRGTGAPHRTAPHLTSPHRTDLPGPDKDGEMSSSSAVHVALP